MQVVASLAASGDLGASKPRVNPKSYGQQLRIGRFRSDGGTGIIGSGTDAGAAFMECGHDAAGFTGR